MTGYVFSEKSLDGFHPTVAAELYGFRNIVDWLEDIKSNFHKYASIEVQGACKLGQRAAVLKRCPYAHYLGTLEWRMMRANVLDRDGHRCVRCGAVDSLQIHHKNYKRRGYECMTDLETLCRTCHAKEHGKDEGWL